MIKEASNALGAELHELFAAMMADRKYEDMMDASQKLNLKGRLKDQHGTEKRIERR